MLFTTLHQIHEELKRRGEVRAKTKSYSYPQIREALEVLAKCKIHLKSEDDGDDLVFSPIADFGYFNDKSSKGNHPDAAKATVYVRFNALITQAILSRSWRQINYAAIIGADIYLVRWFRKILGLRFSQAAPNKSYNIKLSTIIENSGITLYGRMSDNLKYVEQSLAAMPDVVARYTVEKEFQVNTVSRKGRMLADAKIVIRPTHGFVLEQIKTNVHENRLEKAAEGEDGHVVLEPERADYKSLADYDRARAAYLGSRPLQPSQSKKKLPFIS